MESVFAYKVDRMRSAWTNILRRLAEKTDVEVNSLCMENMQWPDDTAKEKGWKILCSISELSI